MSDVLAYIDQATFFSLRASGRAQLIQYVWLYDRPVDMAGVERFHQNFGHGLAGRLIEPSALPFGRHRWVAAKGPAAPLDVAEIRSPSDLGAWIEERSQLRIDPVRGPGWHLGVLPMTDGATAVSLVVSHCLLDGGASVRAIIDAVNGNLRDFGYRPPRSRTKLAALASDGRQVIRDLPEAARTAVMAAKLIHRSRSANSSAEMSGPPSAAHRNVDPVVLPAVSALVDTCDWDRRAGDLGGTTYSMLSGFAALLGERLGRARPADGAVRLLIAISDRAGDADQRGNAMKIASVPVDPAPLKTDLTAARSEVREALTALRGKVDEKHALLPITPFIPARAFRQASALLFGELAVSCSNLGQLAPEFVRADGTDAAFFAIRPIDQGVTRGALEQAGGQLVVVAGRVAETISISVVGYEVGADNSREWLADNVVQTLTDLGLKGTII